METDPLNNPEQTNILQFFKSRVNSFVERIQDKPQGRSPLLDLDSIPNESLGEDILSDGSHIDYNRSKTSIYDHFMTIYTCLFPWPRVWNHLSIWGKVYMIIASPGDILISLTTPNIDKENIDAWKESQQEKDRENELPEEEDQDSFLHYDKMNTPLSPEAEDIIDYAKSCIHIIPLNRIVPRKEWSGKNNHKHF